MSSNKELIQKADMALADLATAGKLNPDQNKRFIRKLITYPTILKQVRAVTMNSPTMKINKIWFGSRVMRPASQTGSQQDAPLDTSGASAYTNTRYLPTAQRVKPDLAQIQLTTQEVMAEIRLPYEVLEDNIEGGNPAASDNAGGLQNTIIELLGERAAVDLEELALQGDTASGDAYLALQDGYLKRISSNVVNVGATITKDACKSAIKAMPDQYLRNRGALIHFLSIDNETEMRDQYANRPTGLGDANLQGNLPLYVFGSQLQGAPMMPSANGLFCDPKNLIFGIQRQVSLEYDKDIRSREFIIVLTCRVAFQIEEETACVKYTGIA